jgi:hypothetical protein
MDEMNDEIARFLGVSGTVGNRTYVKGRKRRSHSRRRRGTVRKAVVNQTLSSISGATKLLNAVGSSVHRVINHNWKDIRESGLWFEMLSRMRACTEKNDLSLLSSFIGLNFHKRYPLQDFFLQQLKISITPDDERIMVRLDVGSEPLQVKRKVTACRVTMTAIYPYVDSGITNQKNEPVSHHEIIHSDWLSTGEALQPMRFSFERPVMANYCVLCLVVETMEGNTPVTTLSGRRGAVVGVVEM